MDGIVRVLLLLLCLPLTATAQIILKQANLQHGMYTSGVFSFSGQAAILSGGGTDIVGANEVTVGDITSWDNGFTTGGMARAIFDEHPAVGDGNAIWYRSSTVTVNQTYSHDLVNGTNPTSGSSTFGWDGSTDIRRSVVAAKVTISGTQLYVVAVHLCPSACRDSSGTTESVQRVNQINDLISWISTTLTGGLPVVILGDLNLARDTAVGGGGTQIGLFTDAGYSDLWVQAIAEGKATANWGDRNSDSIADMPIGTVGTGVTTRTHDSRWIDFVLLKGSGLSLTSLDIPDLRETCPHGLVAGGAMPSCSPEVTGGPNVSGQQWDIPEDFGVRPSDHNWVTLTLTQSAPTISTPTTVNVCDTSALINFNTNIPATSYVEYGTTTSYGSTTLHDTLRYRTEHLALIGAGSLSPNTLYHARAVAIGGSTALGNDFTFTTAANGTACRATPVEVDDAMPDMTGAAAEYVVKTDCTGFSNCYTNLQTAINDAATSGSKRYITVDAGTTHTGSFELPAKSGTNYVIIRSSAHASLPAGERVSPSDAASMFKITNTNVDAPLKTAIGGTQYWRIIGAEITMETSAMGKAPNGNSQSGLVRIGTGSETLASQLPNHVGIDRCYVHGLDERNFVRGIYGNGDDWFVVESYVSKFHSTGQDSQAVLSLMTRRVKIRNNYLEGAGENFMTGGATVSIPGFVISDIDFRENDLPGLLSWKANDPTAEGTTFTADTGTDALTATSHGFTVNYQLVRLRSSGTLPAPLATMTSYYVRSTTTNTLQLGPEIPFTADASTNIFTATAHGMANDLEIRLDTTSSLPSPLNSSTNYYVINQTANTFQLATTVGGGAIDITTAGGGTMVVRGGTPINLTTTGSGTHYLLLDWVNKNRFELKTSNRALIFGNLIHGWWASEQTQGILNLKLEDNSTVADDLFQDVTVYKNKFYDASMGIIFSTRSIAGAQTEDYGKRIGFMHNLIELDGVTWDNEDTGADSPATALFIGAGSMPDPQYADYVEVFHNTWVNANPTPIGSTGGHMLLLGAVSATHKGVGLVFRDNIVGHREFGIKADGQVVGTTSLNAAFTGYTWTKNLMVGGTAGNYPECTLCQSAWSSAQFVNFNNGVGGNYRLAVGSPGKGTATDSTDVGADIDAIERATESTLDGIWPTTSGGVIVTCRWSTEPPCQ